MKVSFLRMTDAGSMDIFNSARDYRSNAQVVSAPDISVDFAAVAASIATKKLRESLLDKLGGDGEERENSGEDAATAEEGLRDQLTKKLRKLFD